MKHAFLALVVLCSAAVALPRGALAQSELVGKWTLNVEKSKFSPGPAPKAGHGHP
jgi:hypothetical protein